MPHDCANCLKGEVYECYDCGHQHCDQCEKCTSIEDQLRAVRARLDTLEGR